MKLNNETKIGILVTAVVIALLALTFRVGNFHFAEKGYTIKAHFYRIEGLEKNAPMRLNGLEVGSVKEIHILYAPETTMELTLWLEERVKLKEGAQAYVKNMGLLGEKYIELTGGNKGGVFLVPGSLIIGQEPMDFEKVIAKGDVIADNLIAISANVKERLTLNRQAIDEIIANLHGTTENFIELSDDLKRNPWKLMYRAKEKSKTQ